MTISSISLVDSASHEPPRIIQLYQYLELFCEGEPPRNTLFVLDRAPISITDYAEDRTLIIDPPTGTIGKFRLDGVVTAIFTGEPRESGLPQLQTQPGGLAHVRIGEHFLDIYSQRGGNVIHFPTLGVVCSGSFGSDAVLPLIVPGSDGSEELDTLRLLAQLVKRNLRLLIPQVGSLLEEPTQAMQRLAEDVSYLHGLRRVVPGLLQRGEALAEIWKITDSLLPHNRNSEAAKSNHQKNIEALWSLVQK